MSETSARFALPLLQAGQAQKEITHNEALTVVDALLHASVRDRTTAAPPAEAEPGECWIVPAGAAAAWAGPTGAIACRTGGGWRFVAPRVGATVWCEAEGVRLRHDGEAWRGGPAIAAPAGGTVVDAEARASLAALIAALRQAGILAS
jgi:hypothetical protein